jgi:hypothetical protein
VGPVGSQEEAEFTLRADVPAGTYHVIFDAIIISSVDTTFTLIWRSAGGDTTLAEWTQHFEPLRDQDGNPYFDAQPYEFDVDAPAIDIQPPADDATLPDQLVLRYAGANGMISMAFIPNGDGERAKGRIPNITLPK